MAAISTHAFEQLCNATRECMASLRSARADEIACEREYLVRARDELKNAVVAKITAPLVIRRLNLLQASAEALARTAP